MSAPPSGRWADIVVTTVLLGVGIYGVVTALGFPERARIWPVSVMALLVLATLVHLVLSFRAKDGAADEPSVGDE